MKNNAMLVRSDRLLLDFQCQHSDLQIDSFIINRSGYGHPWGMYIQVLRELNSRKSSWEQISAQVKDYKFRLEENALERPGRWRAKWSKKADLKRRRLSLESDSIRTSIEVLNIKLSECKREWKRFLVAGNRLKKEIGVVTDVTRAVWDKKWIIHKLMYEIAISFIGTNKIPSDMVATISSLPADAREKLMPFVLQPNQAVAEFMHGLEMGHHVVDHSRFAKKSSGGLQAPLPGQVLENTDDRSVERSPLPDRSLRKPEAV